MEDRQPQHQKNVNRRQNYDCSSEEKTRFQYIPHYTGKLDQFLVQNQHNQQQQLLYGESVEEYLLHTSADLWMFGD